MIFPGLCDPELPALERLDQADLARITGAETANLLRFRYQPGARAVLHVALGDAAEASEGSIWFYAGRKTQGLMQRLPVARLDAVSGALFQAFPHDHRMPHLATFVAGAADFAPQLIGGKAAVPPDLMRYRPGLSATFRWTRTDGRVFYVKLTPDSDVSAQAHAVAGLAAATCDPSLSFAAVEGVMPDLGLIAYAAAEGQPLDRAIAGAGPDLAGRLMEQTVRALGRLWTLPAAPTRVLDRSAHLLRSEQARKMIALMDPEAGKMAAALEAELRAAHVPVRRQTIHADMKLDHAFLSGDCTTLIDIESLSLGDPDYDLAKLEARLHMAVLARQITAAEAAAGVAALRPFVGPHYLWFLTCARMQCAKFFAQRFSAATFPLMRKVLAPC
jgi:hypothetical protein